MPNSEDNRFQKPHHLSGFSFSDEPIFSRIHSLVSEGDDLSVNNLKMTGSSQKLSGTENLGGDSMEKGESEGWRGKTEDGVLRDQKENRSIHFFTSIFTGIFYSPLLWGTLLTVIFYVILLSGVIQSEFMMRYFAGSKIEYVEVGMFFVGMAALFFKWGNIRWQRNWMKSQLRTQEKRFLTKSAGHFSFSDVSVLLTKLNALPYAVQNGYFVSRLQNALDYIHRNQSSVGLEDEIKYLSDMDAERMSQSYSLIRLVIWAIPILGFLGTVMGITLAIGALGGNLSDTAATLPQMISGLSVAFDTTAIALAFSIILMFTQFMVEKSETRLLNDVDFQIHREISGRFDPIPDTLEGTVLAIRRVGEVVLEGMEKHSYRQGKMWQESFAHVETEWSRRLETLGITLVTSLKQALAEGGEMLGGELRNQLTSQVTDAGTRMGEVLAKKMEKQLSEHFEKQIVAHVSMMKKLQEMMGGQCAEIQAAVSRNVDGVAKNVDVLAKSSEIFYHAGNQMEKTTTALTAATEMACKVSEMEQVLARNLSTLQGARNFERTVAELAQATKLLTQWLEEVRRLRKAG